MFFTIFSKILKSINIFNDILHLIINLQNEIHKISIFRQCLYDNIFIQKVLHDNFIRIIIDILLFSIKPP